LDAATLFFWAYSLLLASGVVNIFRIEFEKAGEVKATRAVTNLGAIMVIVSAAIFTWGVWLYF
jgi:hypothetical protein